MLPMELQCPVGSNIDQVVTFVIKSKSGDRGRECEFKQKHENNVSR